MKKGDTIRIKIKVKSSGKKKLPDWGLGQGILAEQDIVLGEDVTKENKLRYLLKIEEVYGDMVIDTIEQVLELVKPSTKPKHRTKRK